VLTLGGRMKTRRLFSVAVLSLFIAWVAAGAAEAQPRSIKGEVTDVATGDPLPGVTVTVEGTTLSATTASDGAFTIPDAPAGALTVQLRDRKSTRLNSSHGSISYAVFCLKKKNKNRLS